MRVGISIKTVFPLMEDLQEFLEDILAELDDMKDVEVHTNDLDEFTIFLLNLAEKLKIRYTVHCPHFYSEYKVNFCSSKKRDIENAEYWLKKSIKYAKELKSKYIVIHPDVSKNAEKNQALDILEGHIKTNLKLLNKGQKILIENMPSEEYPLSTPEEFKTFLKRFDNRVGICWDVGHEIGRFKNQNFKFPKILKSKIKEVHISGVIKFKDHYPLTKGNLNLFGCIESLKKINYNGAIIFEIITNNPLDIINSKKEIDRFI